ncbi:MAG TPA: thiamine diphosphokinase [Firmicutes bacterium]|nr:thiamine diphosphokinase [Bacillota bacterium]
MDLHGKRVVVCVNGHWEHLVQTGWQRQPDDFVIAADGGYYLAKALGLELDLLIGDFDSLPAELVRELAQTVTVIRFPVAKDMTDLELAMDWALARGCREILVLGGLGKRLDHTLGGIWLLPRWVRAGVPVMFWDPSCTVTAAEKEVVLTGQAGDILSLFPVTQLVEGIETHGLKYPLVNGRLRWGETLGVSNEFQQATVRVTWRRGILLAVHWHLERGAQSSD